MHRFGQLSIGDQRLDTLMGPIMAHHYNISRQQMRKGVVYRGAGYRWAGGRRQAAGGRRQAAGGQAAGRQAARAAWPATHPPPARRPRRIAGCAAPCASCSRATSPSGWAWWAAA
jgi:hypothetical protein